jgi:hypothetical protein
MKRLLILALTVLICILNVHADDLKVEAVMATSKDSKPADIFDIKVKKLYAFFKTEGSKKGDKLRAVWIAEDVGDAADPNTTIDETTLTAEEDNFYGAFSLSKPTKGWPEGSYRVDIYSGDQIVTTAKFSIKKGGKPESEEDEKEESSSGD